MSDIRNFFSSDRSAKRRAVETEEEPKKKTKVKSSLSENKEPNTVAESSASLFTLLTEPKWKDLLAPEFKKSYFKQLEAFLVREQKKKATIYPPKADIFAALNLCPFDGIKVVIIGQDPYHGPGQAHGLCFSVQRGVPPPPSLKNIYKEACSDVGIPKPSHGSLLSWCNQGVLLLNTVLTVRASEANSHKKQGWETFTDAVIRLVNEHATGVVFLLWGKPAQDKGALISRAKHCIITSSHPSPLGATKTNEPFIGSKCFSRANEYLTKSGKTPIDWTV
ncbi:hypothetical protein Ae201684P_011078 [Aphanomyces euteiches]|uniref:Uracil-DNA glycosylase n=1 Tax=Aphanomyces euteiches TaxID=100861 RepID=A0A6G0XWG6_9STRA|nr:hypothetical protein Ae201684_000625 [Aphanomyces euteiches]KAF0745055.1 hypothetical protein Ae201684_000631 [Aphanomyces euteiches]KAH9091410.1 hypothetical protein Ae201684P_010957 [Aphanomyces euteiches]KAH9091533.1 hypothetical protein Ae201684P_011078 [Aphanomyces euteiches]KAH9148066.1 hypothetical protein AeRB84_008443 [Aphanomyces euteiches]